MGNLQSDYSKWDAKTQEKDAFSVSTSLHMIHILIRQKAQLDALATRSDATFTTLNNGGGGDVYETLYFSAIANTARVQYSIKLQTRLYQELAMEPVHPEQNFGRKLHCIVRRLGFVCAYY